MSKKQGINLLCYDTLDSTQLEAKRLFDQHGYDGKPTLIVAKSQHQGRGRLDRKWTSPVGNLYCTLMIALTIQPNIVPLASSVGLAKGLKLLKHPEVKYKWPNDLLWTDKKFAGILVEKIHDVLFIGMGVNLISHPEDTHFPSICISGYIPLHREADINLLATDIAYAVQDTLQMAQYSSQEIIDLWISKAYKYQELVVLRNSNLRGYFVGINTDGAMLLEVNNQIQTISFGDVS